MSMFFKRRKRRNYGIDVASQKPSINPGSYPKEVPKHEWVDAPGENEDFPEGMVCGGKLETGQLAYIACCRIEDQTAAGFVEKESRVAYLPYGTTEHSRRNYKLLIAEKPDSLVWMRCANGRKPKNTALVPLQAKTDIHRERGEVMLVGRTCTHLSDGHTFDNHRLQVSKWAMTGSEIHRPGKIHPSHGVLYVPFSGREYMFSDHEMLMMKITPGSLQSICRWRILKHLSLLKKSQLNHIDKLPLPVKLKNFLKEQNE